MSWKQGVDATLCAICPDPPEYMEYWKGNLGSYHKGTRTRNCNLVPESNNEPWCFSLLNYNFCRVKCTNIKYTAQSFHALVYSWNHFPNLDLEHGQLLSPLLDKQVILTQPIITFYISMSGDVSSLFTHTQICWLCLICSTKSYLGKCEQNWLMNRSPSGTKASEIQTPIPSYEHYWNVSNAVK